MCATEKRSRAATAAHTNGARGGAGHSSCRAAPRERAPHVDERAARPREGWRLDLSLKNTARCSAVRLSQERVSDFGRVAELSRKTEVRHEARDSPPPGLFCMHARFRLIVCVQTKRAQRALLRRARSWLAISSKGSRPVSAYAPTTPRGAVAPRGPRSGRATAARAAPRPIRMPAAVRRGQDKPRNRAPSGLDEGATGYSGAPRTAFLSRWIARFY
eukprot:354140-Chlamydomonas_euryale.AAC.9